MLLVFEFNHFEITALFCLQQFVVAAALGISGLRPQSSAFCVTGLQPSLCGLLTKLDPPLVIINPLMGTGNYSAAANNMKLVHWSLMGGLFHLVQRGGDWAGPQPAQALFAVPNVTPHPSTASVPITILLYNGPLLCGFNVPIKGLTNRCTISSAFPEVVLSGCFLFFTHWYLPNK